MTTKYQVLLSGGVFDFETRSIIPPDKSSAQWFEYQSWLTAGNTPLPPSSVGTDDLATSKLKRKAEIDSYAAGLRNIVVRGRSAGEMASWAIKINEARTFNATQDPLQAPTLAAIATVRGIEVQALVDKVLTQATPFLQAEAVIDGIRGKHCDAIDACLTVQEIVVYDWHTGWPAL